MAVVVTQLVVDASGSKQGLADFIAGLKKAEQQAVATGNATAKTFEKTQAQWTNLVSRTDPLVKAQIAMEKDLAKARETSANAVKLGITTQAAANAQLEKVTQYHKNLAANIGQTTKATEAHVNASKLQRYEMINLGRQLQDVGVSLFSGQSPLTVLVQQGSQIADISASSGVKMTSMFKQVGSAIGSVLTPMRLVTGGVIGLGIAAAYTALQWDDANKAMERSLIGPGARTGTTVGDINTFSKANSSPSGLSISEARNAGIELTKTGDITISKLKGVGEAIHGYSVLTGKDATEATKDLVNILNSGAKGVDELSKTYGSFNASARDNIRVLSQQTDQTASAQAMIDRMRETNVKAEKSVSALSAAWTKFKNIAGEIVNPSPPQRESPQEQLDTAKSRLAEFQSGNSPFQNEKGFGDAIAADVARAQRAVDSFNAEAARAQLDSLSLSAQKLSESILPQIPQMEALEAAIVKLREARERGAATPQSEGALTIAQNQLQALRESTAESLRYNQRVAEISRSWGDVGQATALALQAASNNLPVAQAVGGAMQMAAKYTADFKNYMDQGKTATEATALAASNLATAQAQVNASAKETLWTLQNEYQVAAARNGQEQIAAQQRATYNKLVHDGVNKNTAEQVANQEAVNKTATVEKQIRGEILALRKAAVNEERDIQKALEMEDSAMGSIKIAQDARAAGNRAFADAMERGATASAAVSLSTATIANYIDRAAAAAENFSGSMQNAGDAAKEVAAAMQAAGGANNYYFGANTNGTGGGSKDIVGLMSAQEMMIRQEGYLTPTAQQLIAKATAGGSIDAGIAALKNATVKTGPGVEGFPYLAPGATYQDLGLGDKGTQDDITSALMSLYDTKAAGATGGSRTSIIQEEIATLQGLPQTQKTLDAIADLTQSLQTLDGSTNSLRKSNEDLLSPYYTQDPRTSHIGYRTQGMANEGDFTVPGGYSANDNVSVTMPLASGEIVSVRRPGSKSGGQSINVTNHITVGAGADMDQFKRTVFQATQNTKRQLSAAS